MPVGPGHGAGPVGVGGLYAPLIRDPQLSDAEPQFFGDEAEVWFDGQQDLEQALVPGGYQQRSDNVIQEGWDHFQTDDDDYVVIDDYQVIDVVPPSQYYGEDAELLDQEDDEQPYSDDQTSFPGDAPIDDAWIWFDSDEDEYPQDEYQSGVIAAPTAYDDAWDWWGDEPPAEATGAGYQQQDVEPQIEDAWDWSQDDAQDDYDLLVDDDYQPSAVVLAASQYYGEDAELLDQEDDDQVVWPNDPTDGVAAYYGDDAEQLAQEDDDQAVVDSQPTLTGDTVFDDGYDFWGQEEDDYPVVDDYALVSVAVTTLQYYGEDAELLDQDDDEQALPDTDWLVASVAPPPYSYLGDDAELEQQDGDEWLPADDQVSPPDALVFDEGYDHWVTDDDEQWAHDQQVTPPDALVQTDGWDHFSTDDDEWAVPEDYQPSVLPLPAIEDSWDHFSDDSDEMPPPDEYQAAVIVNPLLCAEDPWEHFLSDDSDWYYVADDYEFPATFVALISGAGFAGGFALGIMTGPTPRPVFTLDPRFFNGSNAWLGFRTSSGGGVW